MKKIDIKNIFQNSNKVFLFILISTTLIWFILKLSKTYTDVIEIKYQLKDLPKNQVIEQTEDDYIKVQIEAKGAKLIRYHLFGKTIEIDFDELKKVNNAYLLTTERMKSIMQREIDLPNENFDIKTKDINFTTYQLHSKKVGINPNIKIDFATGYDSVSGFSFTPDSLTIYGNKKILDTINEVSTLTKVLKNVKESQDDKVKIDIEALNIHDISQNEISYKLEVAKFTEKKIQLPIEVINVPDDVEVSIFPKEIQISFEVELKHYEAFTLKDFRLICDFKNRKKDDDVLTPKLAMKPKNIKKIKLNTSRVNYLIRE